MKGDCIGDNEGCNAKVPAMHEWITVHPGPSTYLHAGASLKGWPADHSTEDTFDLPPPLTQQERASVVSALRNSPVTRAREAINDALSMGDILKEAVKGANDKLSDPNSYKGHKGNADCFDHSSCSPEYKAAFTQNGGAILVLYTPAKIIGRFDTFADATLAAQALNEMKGY